MLQPGAARSGPSDKRPQDKRCFFHRGIADVVSTVDNRSFLRAGVLMISEIMRIWPIYDKYMRLDDCFLIVVTTRHQITAGTRRPVAATRFQGKPDGAAGASPSRPARRRRSADMLRLGPPPGAMINIYC